MKKQYILILVIILIAIIIISANIIQKQNKEKQLQNYNLEYEKYLNKEIYGTDLASIINKAMDNNARRNVQKDEKGLYLNNGQDSILVEIVLIIDEEKNQTKSYRMENIQKVGIAGFISNFNTTVFKSSNVEYHKNTGKISRITFEQQ